MEAIGKNYVKNILSDIFCLCGVNCVVAKQMSSSNDRATEDTSMIVHTSCSIPIWKFHDRSSVKYELK